MHYVCRNTHSRIAMINVCEGEVITNSYTKVDIKDKCFKVSKTNKNKKNTSGKLHQQENIILCPRL